MNTFLHFAAMPRRQRGLTLVELMIAITLGLILTAGMIQIFVSSKQTYRVEEAHSRLQESARLALEMVASDVRMASYWGCQPDPANVVNLLNTGGTGYVDFTGVPLTGIEGTSGAPDTLTLRGADGATGLTLQPNLGTGFNSSLTAALVVAAPNTLAAGDIVLVSNCEVGNIFQISALGGGGSTVTLTAGGSNPGNAVGAFTAAFRGDATLYPMRNVVYSIATGANGVNALWRSVNGTNQELVSDVTDMQILYGEDTNGDRSVERYVPANAAGLNFDNVFSVRIQLTIRTGEDNTSVTAGNALSRVFSTTVSIRNRVL